MFASIADGVVRVRTFDCGGSPKAEGSGFLVGESVVMTARHVVRGACSVKVRASGKWIRVVSGTFWTTGKDAGVAEDLETLKLAAPAPGHIFDFRSSPAPRGLNLAMIGYPLGNDVSFTQGRIKAVLRLHSVPLIVVNLLGAEGASGSAFVDNNGEVVGILQIGLGGKDIAGELTSGIVAGIDLSRWWPDAQKRLCQVYPRGGIPNCGASIPSPPPAPPPNESIPKWVVPGDYFGATAQGGQISFTVSRNPAGVFNFDVQQFDVSCIPALALDAGGFTMESADVSSAGTFGNTETGVVNLTAPPVAARYSRILKGEFSSVGYADGVMSSTLTFNDASGVLHSCSSGEVTWSARVLG